MKKVLLLTALIIITGCATLNYYKYNIEHIEDEFDGYVIDRMHGNYIPGGGAIPTNSLLFNAQRFINKEGDKHYHFYVQYHDIEWLFINEGEKLVLLVDGERVGFTGKGSFSHREVLQGYASTAVKETALFGTTPEALVKIANAKSVKIKLIGTTRDIQRELSQEHITNFKKFVDEYVETVTAYN